MAEKPVEIQFADKNVKKAFENINDQKLKQFIGRALEDIENDPFCGIQIPKKLIPKEYIKKYKVKNLWKYDLPRAWRLIYSIEGGTLKIVTIVLEWMNHKEYEKRFKYKR